MCWIFFNFYTVSIVYESEYHARIRIRKTDKNSCLTDCRRVGRVRLLYCEMCPIWLHVRWWGTSRQGIRGTRPELGTPHVFLALRQRQCDNMSSVACKKQKLLSPWFQNELAVKIDLLLIIQKRVRNNNAKLPRVLNSPGAKILSVLVTKKLVEK